MTPRIRLLLAESGAVLLTSTALHPLIAGPTWFPPVLFAVLVVVAVSELARRAGVLRVLIPLVALVGLVLELVVAAARDVAPYGLLPSPAALNQLLTLAQGGVQDSSRYVAPADPTAGLLLLAAAGVGGIAVVVDTVAVTLRRPALAGLPLLALYAVLAAISAQGAPWYSFALGGAGYLWLLYAESRERVSRWGRVLGTGGRRVRSSALSSNGRRVGGTALAFALVVPALLPGLEDHAVHFGSGGSATGSGRIGTGDPLVDLARDLGQRTSVPVMDLTLPAPQGGAVDPGAPYLRTAEFDAFDARTSSWKHGATTADVSSTGGRLSLPWGDLPGVGRTVTVAAKGAFRSSFLPIPYGGTTISGLHGSWIADEETREVRGAGRTTVSGMTYHVDQTEPLPDARQLLEAKAGPAAARYMDTTGLQRSLVVQRTLRQAVGDEKRPYAQALLLQNYFHTTGGFRYDVNAPVAEPGHNLIETFLLDKSGFCVHYATAMVMLARVLGIPARLAVGYLPGTQQASQDNLEHFRVTTLQAHAWPELYFTDFGWLRFEPTPRSDGLTETPAYATARTPADIALLTPSSSAAPSTGASTGASAARPKASDREVIRSTGGGGPIPTAAVNTGGDVVLGLVAALLVVLLVPALLRVRLRRSRLRSEGPAAPLALWEELCDSARDLGLPFPAPAQTARQYAALLARYAELPGDSGSPLQVLVAAYERSAYAGGANDTATAAARDALVEVRAALASCVLRRERWRAAVLPASSWRAIRTGGSAMLARLRPRGSASGLGGLGGLVARWSHREA